MAFCTSCGAELQSGAGFCPGCGTQVRAKTAPGARPAPALAAQAAGRAVAGSGARLTVGRPPVGVALQDVRGYLMMGLAGLGGLALLSLMLSNSLGLILSGALACAAYFLAFKKLEEGDEEGAKNGSLIVGVIVAVIGLAVVFMRDMLGILDICVGVPFLMTWNALK